MLQKNNNFDFLVHHIFYPNKAIKYLDWLKLGIWIPTLISFFYFIFIGEADRINELLALVLGMY